MSPGRARPVRRATSESRAPWMGGSGHCNEIAQEDVGVEEVEVERVQEVQKVKKVEEVTKKKREEQGFSDGMDFFNSMDFEDDELLAEAEGGDVRRSSVRFDLTQNYDTMDASDGSDAMEESDPEDGSDSDAESDEDMSTDEECTDEEDEEEMLCEEEEDEGDWVPSRANIMEELADLQEEEVEVADVHAGRGGKLYVDCVSRQGKRKKVNKMVAANSDHGLNLAFARDVMKEEDCMRVKEADESDDITMSRDLAALSLIKQAKMSRSQYLTCKYWLEDRAQLGEDNSSLPSWGRVTGERKKALPENWPAEGEATAVEARIGLQHLLDATVRR